MGEKPWKAYKYRYMHHDGRRSLKGGQQVQLQRTGTQTHYKFTIYVLMPTKYA
jgi:hypothetical protein